MKYILFFVLIVYSSLSAQNTRIKNNSEITKITEDSVITRVIDCNSLFTLNNRKKDYLKKRPFLYSEPYYLRVYNNKRDYAAVQMAKRKRSRPFLFIKVFTFNTCIKQDEVLEYIMDNKYRYRMSNITEPNCDGFVISKLKRKDLKKLLQNKIINLKVLSFNRDFEFHLTEEEGDRFHAELQCLKYNKFKYK